MSDFARGEEIKRLRKTKGLSRENLAGELGVTTKSVYAWERHNGGIQGRNAAKLATFFDVDVESLVVREETIQRLIANGVTDPDQIDRMEIKLDWIIARLTGGDEGLPIPGPAKLPPEQTPPPADASEEPPQSDVG
jgi:transcriptional regulator with XRE-family HTH domain